MIAAPDLAVILAAGRGTRMMADAAAASGLDPDQRAMARDGLKMLIPFRGRPFIAWIVDAVTRAGYRDTCVVTGPGTVAVRESLNALGMTVAFAEQTAPLGTAHAVLATEAVVGARPFVVINGDNWYPPDALAQLRTHAAPATIGFRPRERVEAFALLQTNADGCLTELVEKPDPSAQARLGADALVSMTCWSFTADIFDACRSVAPSARGELELPDAVRLLVAGGACVRVLSHDGPVLDLSYPADIPVVAKRLPA